MIHIVNIHTVSGFCHKLNIVPVLQQKVVWTSVCENLIMIHLMCSCLQRFVKNVSRCSWILVSETCVLHLVTCCGRPLCTHYYLSYSCTVGRTHDTYTELSIRCSLDCGLQGFDYIGYVLGAKNCHFWHLVSIYIYIYRHTHTYIKCQNGTLYIYIYIYIYIYAENMH